MNLPVVVRDKPSWGQSLIRRVAESTFRKAFGTSLAAALSNASSRWVRIWDNYAGQWQQDVEVRTEGVLTFSAVFSCLRLISTDIGKLPLVLKQQSATGAWREIPFDQQSPFRAVLEKPNPHQTRIKFLEQWIISKLIRGNAYVLKSRDGRGVVRELRVLDPHVVQPMVSTDGEVFYRVVPGDQLATPELTGEVFIPAREIIHDMHFTPEHALIGVSPIGACGLAATQGLKIQQNSAKFFANQSRAGFVLSTAGKITTDQAQRLKADWESMFGGANYGKTAVLGDGLEPKSFTVNAVDAQLVEQLNWSAADVCRAFGVPAYKIGIGAEPTRNMEQLQQEYFSGTLQELIECVEALLTEGLEVSPYRVYLDIRQLLRLDTTSRYKAHRESIAGGWKAPNEVRLEEEMDPVEGGDSPMIQQQNFSLAALAKRDAKPDPFASAPKPGGSGDTPSGGGGDTPPPDNQQNEFDVLARDWSEITDRHLESEAA